MDAMQLPLMFDRSKYRPAFADWLMANHHVWLRFCAEANKVWERGRRHYSARTIIEVLRHESALTEVGGAYKLNDHNTPDLARLYQETFPDRASLFETRLQHGSARAA